jgi:general secretion pathway protein D
MNFHGAPLDLVLNYLSDAAGFVVNKQTEVRGAVEVWSKQPVTRDEAIELLSSTLKKNGYGMTRNGRILTIVSMDTVKTADTEIAVNSDPNELKKSDEVQTQIIPVRYAKATQLIQNFQQLLPPVATLSANESANTLILVATKTDIKRMLTILKALDTSMAAASSIKVRLLRYADAKETASLITQLFAQQNTSRTPQANRGNAVNFGGGPGGSGFGGPPGMMPDAAAATGGGERNSVAARVVAVPDERSNAVIVSAPAESIAAIDDMLNKLDQQVSDVTELRLFHLTNSDPSELADQLTRLFSDGSSSNNTDQDGSPPFFFPGGGGPMVPGPNTSPETGERLKKMGKVLSVADPRTSSLIMTAARTLMPQIAQMVATLDSDQGKREVVSYFELRNADPQDVYQNLQELFNRNNAHSDNNNQSGLLGRNNPLGQRQTQNQQSTSGTTTSLGTSSVGSTGRSGQ